METLEYTLTIYIIPALIDFILYDKLVEEFKRKEKVVRHIESEMTVEDFVFLVSLLPIFNIWMIFAFIKNKIWP